MTTDADQKLLHTAFRPCHADRHFRARFVAECRKQQATHDEVRSASGWDRAVQLRHI
jgi:hypothetical protein